MPTLFYRYILGDLLRVFALTAVVLVTVIAFGATLKPLTDDGLFTVADTIKYLMLAIMPMLQFALPFAAGFASTIVLHRMTNDNEIVAAAASGISYRRLLAPLVVLGIALVLIMVLLTQWAIPRTWAVMERIATAEVTRLFEASIDRGRPFQIGNLQIYADNMWVVANPSDTQAETRLILSRVVAAELDRDGRIETDVTANQAVVDVHRFEGQTFLTLVLHDAVAFDGDPGQLARVPQLQPDQAILIPSVFRDQLRVMTIAELMRLRRNPDRHGRVLEYRLALAEAVREESLWSLIAGRLGASGSVELTQTGQSQRRYVLQADRVENGQFANREGRPIVVQQFEGNTLKRSISAKEVRLNRTGGASFTTPLFELQMNSVEVTDHREDGAVNRRERWEDHNLTMLDLDTMNLADMPSGTLLAHVAAMDSPPSAVRRGERRLQDQLVSVHNEITGRMHSRFTQSVTVLLLLLIGAVLAMWLRGSMPLVIYIWAFAPSILSLILISGGEKMVRDGSIFSGFMVMWSGNIALLVMLTLAYARLTRN